MTQIARAKAALLPAMVLLAVIGAETTAFADERELCASAAEQAQQLRDEGKYRKGREQMLVCARDVCPGPIKSDCGKWLTDLDRDAPTVVFGARDQATTPARDLTEVKVSIDGVQVTERLDGKPLMVDAGEHTFKFEYQGEQKEEKVLVRSGEKGRSISVVFGAVVAPPPPPGGGDEKTEGSIVPALVVGGIGVVALGSFAIFGISGKNDVDDLESRCKPTRTCTEDEVDSARTKLIVADISLGIGVVALGVATYMILTRPKIDVKSQQAERRGVRFTGGPIVGGAAAGLGGTF